MREIKITANEADQRIDRFLLKYFNDTTRGNLYKLMRKKVFKLNGKPVTKPETFLKCDDTLAVYMAEETIESLRKPVEMVTPDQVGLTIVYEDDDILIVDKPKGMLTHPDKSEYKNTLATIVQYYLRHLCTATFKPAPVHRLDKNTGGLVLFAKHYESLKHYNALMRDRKIAKYYLCVCEGKTKPKGEVKGYLTKDEQMNKVTLSAQDRDQSKFCHTSYKTLAFRQGYSLVEVALLTGRSHQIRVSMAYEGHPIVGDVKYGGKKRRGETTQLLHAYKLVIEGRVFTSNSESIDSFMESLADS
jgi:23S rRNA pseudouridine955/2504/2580 synthase